MVRQLQSGKADICGASLTITPARSEAIDFSVGLVDDISSLMILNPAVAGNQKPQIDLMVYLTVYSIEAWLAILGIATFSSIVYTALLNQARKELNTVYLQLKKFLLEADHFFLSLIQRRSDTGERMQYAGEKIQLITISTVTFLLFSFYGADLTATMTAGVRTSSLSSFQDVLDEDYMVHTKGGSSLYEFFRTAIPGSTAHQVFEKALIVMEYDEFAKKQQQNPSKAVFFNSIFSTTKHKNFLFLRNFDDAASSQLAFGLQKDSELRDMFNYHLNKLRQSGVLKLLMHKWVKEEKPDDWSHRIFQDDAMPLGYENLFFPTMILLVGVSLGMFLLFMEKMMSTRGRKIGRTESVNMMSYD